MQDPKNITMGKTIFVTGPMQQTKPEDVKLKKIQKETWVNCEAGPKI